MEFNKLIKYVKNSQSSTFVYNFLKNFTPNNTLKDLVYLKSIFG